MATRPMRTMLALIVFSFLLLGCGLPITLSSEGTVTESEEKQMVDWCYENGQILVSCPTVGPYAAVLVNDMGYDESCVWETLKLYLHTGIDNLAECR